MQKKGWVIEAFPFRYKSNDFIVLVRLYLETENRPEYALLKTEIVKNFDLKNSITYPVNSNGFMNIDVKKFREFFGIEFSKNELGNILKQFHSHFSKFIPKEFSVSKSEPLKNLIVASLSNSDSEDPTKIYCYTVTRKGNRTPFNDNKSRLLRPGLYDRFKSDPTISFCYKSEKHDERSDEQILQKFANRINKVKK